MDRSDIVQFLINKNNYKTYLEIGVDEGQNWNKIQCDYKVGVDPNKESLGTTHFLTSDQFFERNSEKFDLIFIDGSHAHHQVYIDIINSLKHLNDNGTIVMHDCNPTIPKRESLMLNGTCWRAFVQARRELDIEAFTVNTDWGCGIIKKIEFQNNKLDITDALDYDGLHKNRTEWLNLKSVQYFIDWCNNDKS